MTGWRKLGIIAGGGGLPVQIANACATGNRAFHVIRLSGFAGKAIAAFPGDECGMGEAGKILKILRREDCDAVVFAGLVKRPDFKALKADMKGVSLLPKIIAAATQGDGRILDVLVRTVEDEGFTVIGAQSVVACLVGAQGALGEYAPDTDHRADIAKAAAIIAALGEFDVGQGAVVARGFVLAIEAAEGTDEMLARCARLPGGVGRGGVLVKRPKPGQELRTDLPTIGAETVRRAIDAGLAGIAFEAERTIILDRDAVISALDDAGMFAYGFRPDEVAN